MVCNAHKKKTAMNFILVKLRNPYRLACPSIDDQALVDTTQLSIHTLTPVDIRSKLRTWSLLTVNIVGLRVIIRKEAVSVSRYFDALLGQTFAIYSQFFLWIIFNKHIPNNKNYKVLRYKYYIFIFC